MRVLLKHTVSKMNSKGRHPYVLITNKVIQHILLFVQKIRWDIYQFPFHNIKQVNKNILKATEAYLDQSFSKYNFTLSCITLLPG